MLAVGPPGPIEQVKTAGYAGGLIWPYQGLLPAAPQGVAFSSFKPGALSFSLRRLLHPPVLPTIVISMEAAKPPTRDLFNPFRFYFA